MKHQLRLLFFFFFLTSDVCVSLWVCVWSDPVLGDRRQKGGGWAVWWWWGGGWKERAWSSIGTGSWTLVTLSWQRSLARLCGRGENKGREAHKCARWLWKQQIENENFGTDDIFSFFLSILHHIYATINLTLYSICPVKPHTRKNGNTKHDFINTK